MRVVPLASFANFIYLFIYFILSFFNTYIPHTRITFPIFDYYSYYERVGRRFSELYSRYLLLICAIRSNIYVRMIVKCCTTTTVVVAVAVAAATAHGVYT